MGAIGVIAQLIRALPLQDRGPGFESLLLHQRKFPSFARDFSFFYRKQVTKGVKQKSPCFEAILKEIGHIL